MMSHSKKNLDKHKEKQRKTAVGTRSRCDDEHGRGEDYHLGGKSANLLSYKSSMGLMTTDHHDKPFHSLDKHKMRRSNSTNSFMYSSSSSSSASNLDSDDELDDCQKKDKKKHSSEDVYKNLPSFVRNMRKPRKLTFVEIKSLNISDKFVNDAQKMFFDASNLAFAPK